jgi:hypothetical protein
MEIGRRELLVGAASLSLVNLVRPPGPSSSAGEEPAPTDQQWHPLTRSLLDRASRAGQRLDRSRVERIIREVSEEHGRPVIKWMESNACIRASEPVSAGRSVADGDRKVLDCLTSLYRHKR